MPGRCQLQHLSQMAEGNVATNNTSPIRRMKLILKRRLTPKQKRAIKQRIAQIIERVQRIRGRQPPGVGTTATAPSLQASERVRVRDWETIKSTLGHWNDLRGCVFMPEMQAYCGTEQRVFKPVRQFLDERDYRMKKCRGIVLLDGVICQGMEEYGPCDRSCYFFWRVEWLEKLE